MIRRALSQKKSNVFSSNYRQISNIERRFHAFVCSRTHSGFDLPQLDDMHLGLYKKRIVQLLDEGSYYEAIEYLRRVEDFVDRRAKGSRELFLKCSILERKAFAFFKLNLYDETVETCDKILLLEKHFQQLDLLDSAFHKLNYACHLKAAALSEQGDLERAIHMLSFLLDKRLRKKLSRTADFRIQQELKRSMTSILSRRAHAYNLLGRNNEALSDLNEAILLWPTSYEYYLRSYVLNEMGRWDEALTDSLKVKEEYISDKTRKELRLIRASCLLNKGHYTKAVDLCNETLALCPDSEEVYNMRAKCYYAMNEFEKCILDCEASESISPSSVIEMLFIKTSALQSLMRMDEMIEQLEKVANIVRGDIFENLVHIAHCNKLLYQGRYDKALQVFNQTLEPVYLTSDKKHFREELILDMMRCKLDVLVFNQLYDEGLKYIERYIKLSDFHSDQRHKIVSLCLKAQLISRTGPLEESLSLLAETSATTALVSNSDSLLQWFKLYLEYSRGRILSIQNKIQAAACFQNALDIANRLKKNDDKVMILNDLIKLELDLGDAAVAVTHLQELLSLVPNHVYSKLSPL